MVNRRRLKDIHENAVIRQFKAYLEIDGVRLKVLDRPEPPEAIVDIDGKRTWIEITDAFLDKKHAIGLTSGACDDVEHVSDDGRLLLTQMRRSQAFFILSSKQSTTRLRCTQLPKA